MGAALGDRIYSLCRRGGRRRKRAVRIFFCFLFCFRPPDVSPIITSFEIRSVKIAKPINHPAPLPYSHQLFRARCFVPWSHEYDGMISLFKISLLASESVNLHLYVFWNFYKLMVKMHWH